MTEHEREVTREVEHERSPGGEQSATAADDPSTAHEREVAREVEHERPPGGDGGADAGFPGTLDVQPEDPNRPRRESPDPVD